MNKQEKHNEYLFMQDEATVVCKIYLEFTRFHRKPWFEVKV